MSGRERLLLAYGKKRDAGNHLYQWPAGKKGNQADNNINTENKRGDGKSHFTLLLNFLGYVASYKQAFPAAF
jgi:hypothetical protein